MGVWDQNAGSLKKGGSGASSLNLNTAGAHNVGLQPCTSPLCPFFLILLAAHLFREREEQTAYFDMKPGLHLGYMFSRTY